MRCGGPLGGAEMAGAGNDVKAEGVASRWADNFSTAWSGWKGLDVAIRAKGVTTKLCFGSAQTWLT